MESLVLAVVGWSAVVVVARLFYPSDSGLLLGCMHLVGRSAECEAQQAAINAVWWRYHTMPLVIGIASGYAAIGVIALAVVRRHRSV